MKKTSEREWTGNSVICAFLLMFLIAIAACWFPVREGLIIAGIIERPINPTAVVETTDPAAVVETTDPSSTEPTQIVFTRDGQHRIAFRNTKSVQFSPLEDFAEGDPAFLNYDIGYNCRDDWTLFLSTGSDNSITDIMSITFYGFSTELEPGQEEESFSPVELCTYEDLSFFNFRRNPLFLHGYSFHSIDISEYMFGIRVVAVEFDCMITGSEYTIRLVEIPS